MNEMYARDISKKIRSSLRIRMKDGSYIGNFPPYGYDKYPGPPIRLVPDPKASPIVKQIFALGAEGRTPAQIARLLNASHILSPSCYRISKYPQLSESSYPSCGKWTANTILKMLHNPVYLGRMVQGKSRKLSFKSRLTIKNPKELWIDGGITHEAIVTEELFQACQAAIEKRKCRAGQ